MTKCLCHSHDASFVESRRAHLEAYLRALIRAPRLLARCTSLKHFLQVTRVPSPDRFFAEQFDFERHRQAYTIVYEPVDISAMEPLGRLGIPNFNNFDDGDEEGVEEDGEPKDSASERLSWVADCFSNCVAGKASLCSQDDEDERWTLGEDKLSLLFRSALMDGMGRECSARASSSSSFSMGAALSVRLSADFSKLDLLDIQAELPPSRLGLSVQPEEDCCRSDRDSVDSLADTDSAWSGSGSECDDVEKGGRMKHRMGMLLQLLQRPSSLDSMQADVLDPGLV